MALFLQITDIAGFGYPFNALTHLNNLLQEY